MSAPIGTAVTRLPRAGGSRARYRVYALTGTGTAARACVAYLEHVTADGVRDERRSGEAGRPIWLSAARLLIHTEVPL